MQHPVGLSLIAVLGVAALAFAAAPAGAVTQMELAQKSACMACHSTDVKIVGPAFKDVAKKYKGNPHGLDILSKKVKNGGAGVWGTLSMPANGPKVSDADIKVLVEWILAM